jgi:pimeloyl-ACP methyl ester carboxylesterase
LGAIDVAGHVADALPSPARVIHYVYPGIEDVDDLLDDIIGAADGHRMETVDVLGHSLGAFLAQCLVRRHGTRVRRVVLSHGYILRPADGSRLRLASSVGRVLPRGLYEWALGQKLRYVLRPVKRLRREAHDRIMREAHAAIRTTASFASVRRNNLWMADAVSRYRFQPADFPDAASRFLIIESDDDPLIPAAARMALRELYPGARVHTFHRTGHVSALAVPHEYARVVDDFLTGTEA